MFPPLAVSLFCTICVVAAFSKLKIGRLLCNADLQQRRDYYSSIIEQECQSVCSDQVLHRTVWMLVALSYWFCTLFLFDTLGDAVGFSGALWVLVFMPLVPLCLYFAHVAHTMYGSSGFRRLYVPKTLGDKSQKGFAEQTADIAGGDVELQMQGQSAEDSLSNNNSASFMVDQHKGLDTATVNVLHKLP
jgi:hypothetical protein